MLRAFGGNKLRYRFQTFTFLNEACSILVGRSHQELAGWNENENHLFAIGQINGFFNLGAQMLGPGGLMGLGPAASNGAVAWGGAGPIGFATGGGVTTGGVGGVTLAVLDATPTELMATRKPR